MRQLPNREAEA